MLSENQKYQYAKFFKKMSISLLIKQPSANCLIYSGVSEFRNHDLNSN